MFSHCKGFQSLTTVPWCINNRPLISLVLKNCNWLWTKQVPLHINVMIGCGRPSVCSTSPVNSNVMFSSELMIKSELGVSSSICIHLFLRALSTVLLRLFLFDSMQYTLSSTIRSSTLVGTLYNVKSWQIDLKPRIERALSVSTFLELSDASFTMNAL